MHYMCAWCAVGCTSTVDKVQSIFKLGIVDGACVCVHVCVPLCACT